MAAVIVIIIAEAVIFGLFGAWVANQKGRDPGEGFLLGLLFSLFGVLIEGLLPTRATALVSGSGALNTGGATSQSAGPGNGASPTVPKWVVPRGVRCRTRGEDGRKCGKQVTHAIFADDSGIPWTLHCAEHIEQVRTALLPTHPRLQVIADDLVSH